MKLQITTPFDKFIIISHKVVNSSCTTTSSSPSVNIAIVHLYKSLYVLFEDKIIEVVSPGVSICFYATTIRPKNSRQIASSCRFCLLCSYWQEFRKLSPYTLS